jgi:hypothetical protein
LLNAEKFGEFPSSFICVVIWLWEVLGDFRSLVLYY